MTCQQLFLLLVLHACRERIRSRVVVDANGCWRWPGANDGRYGHIKLFGARFKVHVAAFLLWKGRIPRGHVLAHSCDVTWCCNPDHVENKLQRRNMQDASERGRIANSLGKRKVALVRRLATLEWGDTRIARHVDCHPSTVRRIRNRESWK